MPHAGRLVLFPQRPLEVVPAVPRLQTSPWSQGRSSSIHSPIRCSPRAFRNAGGVSGAKPARVLLQRNVHSGGRGAGGWKERLERAQGTVNARRGVKGRASEQSAAVRAGGSRSLCLVTRRPLHLGEVGRWPGCWSSRPARGGRGLEAVGGLGSAWSEPGGPGGFPQRTRFDPRVCWSALRLYQGELEAGRPVENPCKDLARGQRCGRRARCWTRWEMGMCLEIELGEDPEPGETEGNGGIGAEPPGGNHLRHLEQLTPLIPKLEVRSGFGTWRARGEALPSAACPAPPPGFAAAAAVAVVVAVAAVVVVGKRHLVMFIHLKRISDNILPSSTARRPSPCR